MREDRLCGACFHPYGWHGDRAVAACLGGPPEVTPTGRSYSNLSPCKIEPICLCKGWKEVNGMSVYISGPMRGYPRFNFDQFYECEAFLKEFGFTSHNPARVDEEEYGFDPDKTLEEQGFDLNAAMSRDLAFIISPECNGVVVLPNWEESVGAKWEVGVAQVVGKVVLVWEDDTLTILDAHEVEPVLVAA